MKLILFILLATLFSALSLLWLTTCEKARTVDFNSAHFTYHVAASEGRLSCEIFSRQAEDEQYTVYQVRLWPVLVGTLGLSTLLAWRIKKARRSRTPGFPVNLHSSTPR